MKAVGYTTPGSIDREDALTDVEINKPHPEGRDILVRIQAVSVNPVDCKIRRN
ncbi:MAG: zinc-binding alcohol dehydrogenase family protein, partial [Alphaproteobacteria bacterium]